MSLQMQRAAHQLYRSSNVRYCSKTTRLKQHSFLPFVQCTDPITRINVSNEYDELKSIIVGHADRDFRLPQPHEDITFDYISMLADEDDTSAFSLGNHKTNCNYNYSRDLINRENDNLNHFAQVLTDLGIKVYRPLNRDIQSQADGVNTDFDFDFVETAKWKAKTYLQAHCPRDLLLIVDNKIIITPTIMRGRRNEIDYFYTNILDNIKKNCKDCEIIDLRSYSSLDNEENELNRLIENKDRSDCINMPTFDAANVLKVLPNVLVYMVSCTGNMSGYKLLQTTLKDEYEIIPLIDFYNGVHIDSTINFVNKETMIFNPERCNYQSCKDIFGKFGIKNFISSPDMYDHGYENIGASTKWIGINILSINPQLVAIDSKQDKLIETLKDVAGIDALKIPLNYARDFAGGAHCVTLDLERES